MAAPKAHKNPGKVRMLDGKVVTQVLYYGKHAGWGKYWAGSVDGVLIEDAEGRPVPFKEIGELVTP